MTLQLERIQYRDLPPKGQESYNYHKVAALLADYGFECCRLHNDTNGADFLAYHTDRGPISVQLKGRPVINKKYLDKKLHIAFPLGDRDKPEEWVWFLYPHDDLVLHILVEKRSMTATKSWHDAGNFAWSRVPAWLGDWLADYEICDLGGES